ncbi:MAG TPA: septation protein A [Steroidobacteraceae bacterium]|nr:septation protein A [Steroidobacteraceae bacterium]
MQQLIDFFPLIAFFVSYWLGGIFTATAVFIAASAIQIGVHWWRTRTVKTLHWVTAALVLVFGSATLLLRDPRFIQWKLSVLMWLASATFLVSQFVGKKPLVQRFLEGTLAEHLAPVNARTWSRINLAWVAFFALVGTLNLYVMRHFSMDAWVNFKVVGVNVLLLLFILPQAFWLASDRHAGGEIGKSKSDG